MIEQSFKEENLSIIQEIESDPNSTQRVLSKKIGISLGKTNYLIKELIKKGVLKAHNFSHDAGKINKIQYILTRKGFEEKSKLLYFFLKRKEEEYALLKQEWEKTSKSNT